MANHKVSELFKHSFIGEVVEILAKSESEEKGMLMVRGYLLDYDEEYLYLGETPLSVNTALKRDLVGLISISEQVDPDLELLENMPTPRGNEEVM